MSYYENQAQPSPEYDPKLRPPSGYEKARLQNGYGAVPGPSAGAGATVEGMLKAACHANERVNQAVGRLRVLEARLAGDRPPATIAPRPQPAHSGTGGVLGEIENQAIALHGNIEDLHEIIDRLFGWVGGRE